MSSLVKAKRHHPCLRDPQCSTAHYWTTFHGSLACVTHSTWGLSKAHEQMKASTKGARGGAGNAIVDTLRSSRTRSIACLSFCPSLIDRAVAVCIGKFIDCYTSQGAQDRVLPIMPEDAPAVESDAASQTLSARSATSERTTLLGSNRSDTSVHRNDPPGPVEGCLPSEGATVAGIGFLSADGLTLLVKSAIEKSR